jgi:hypothetical protein
LQDLEAVHDFTLPKPGRLTVRGECTFPTPGYEVLLRRAVPQGVNPKIPLLNKLVTPPRGIKPQRVTTLPVEYHEVTEKHYAEIEIWSDNVKIKVHEVS